MSSQGRWMRHLPRLGLVALAVVACVGAAEPVPADVPQAFQARSAMRAPLTAITQAGARIVAVGDYGVVVLSDDHGETWRQARAVATRSLLPSSRQRLSSYRALNKRHCMTVCIPGLDNTCGRLACNQDD